MNGSQLSGRLPALIKKLKHVKDILFTKHLLLTNLGISVALAGAGDALEQKSRILKDKADSLDKRRTLNMSLCGLPMGLMNHYWYKILDNKLPGKSLKVVVQKMILDQVLYSPIFISVFFISAGLLEGSSFQQMIDDLYKKGRSSWKILHTMAEYYPDYPSSADQRDMFLFINLFAKFYPCRECGSNFLRHIRRDPPDVRSRAQLSAWFCNVHNIVNRRLMKPTFDCNTSDQRWRSGWHDGSCDW